MEDSSNVAFYDYRMILLTCEQPLREAVVEGLFRTPNTSTFKKIGDVEAYNDTDTSLVHVKGVLYYSSTDYILYKYNVDTKENTRLDIGHRVWHFTFLFGINIDVQCVFSSCNDYCTDILNNNSNGIE